MKKMAAGIVLMLLGLLMVLAGLTLAHGAVTKTRPNSLGVVIPMENPNTSIVGEIVGGDLKSDADGRIAVNLRIHPLKTYNLFDVSIMLCGKETIYGEQDIIDQLTIPDGDKYYFFMGYYVFTYKRVASRLMDGVPCHEFVDVNKIILPPGTVLQNP